MQISTKQNFGGTSMEKVTYKTTKEVSAHAILAMFRRNEWREWYALRDTQDLLDTALFVATAWYGQRSIGIATLFGDGRFYTRLDTLLVDEDWRRRGIGTRLTELVMEKVNHLKPHYCEHDTHTGWLVTFYERFGFEIDLLDEYVQSQRAALNKRTDCKPSAIDDCMSVYRLRQQISEFLEFGIPETSVPFATHNAVEEDGYSRIRISYTSQEGEQIPAFLLLPEGDGPFAAVLIHHQHHGERHLGKSEVCGLVGDPLQAVGPALARQGIVVLAPDSICFEDRRRDRTGTEADKTTDDAQHYNEMAYRLLRGDTLMRKVLSDSAQGISLLRAHPLIDPERVGIMGHSYGGNTVLFHGALDERVHFACSSGAACTYQHKMAHQTGIEMAEVIPGFAARYDIPDLVTCFAPRRLLLVSSTDDKYSQDADRIVTIAQERAAAMGIAEHIEHKRYEGGHTLTQERFNDIVQWLVTSAT